MIKLTLKSVTLQNKKKMIVKPQPDYRWNDQPIDKVEFGYATVVENTQKPMYWYNYDIHASGQPSLKMAAIRITQNGESFVIANIYGSGFRKITNGGTADLQHFGLTGNNTFVEDKSFAIKAYDKEGLDKRQEMANDYFLHKEPELFKKFDSLRRLAKNPKQFPKSEIIKSHSFNEPWIAVEEGWEEIPEMINIKLDTLCDVLRKKLPELVAAYPFAEKAIDLTQFRQAIREADEKENHISGLWISEPKEASIELEYFTIGADHGEAIEAHKIRTAMLDEIKLNVTNKILADRAIFENINQISRNHGHFIEGIEISITISKEEMGYAVGMKLTEDDKTFF